MQREPEHRRDIQGLRAVAVLLVIAAHAGVEALAGGFVGVDVFFVVSGFLITALLLREVATTGRVGLAGFYARRARRILPAATVVLVAVLGYAAHEKAPARVAEIGEDARWTAFFAANVHLARLGEDYFARGRETSPLQHYWSLAVEEQFYLVWPLLLAALALAGRRGTRHLTVVLVLVGAASLGWSLIGTAQAPGSAYYSSPGRAWELAVGALLAVQGERLTGLGRRARWWLGLVGLGAVVVAALAYGPGSEFPGWRAVVPVLGTAALLAAGTGGRAGVGRLLDTPVLCWVGDRSYSLYLWHWPVLVLGGEHTAGLGEIRGTAVLLGVTLVAALASYHLVENPFRRARAVRRGARGLVLWPVALSSVLVAVSVADAYAGRVLEERLLSASSLAGPDAEVLAPPRLIDPPATGRRKARPLPKPTSVDGLLRKGLAAADRGGPVPFPVSNLPNLRLDAWETAVPCQAEGAALRSRICPVGDLDARRTLVLHGDSRSGQWLPALDRVGKALGYRVVPLIKPGCPPYPIPIDNGLGTDFVSCPVWREWALSVVDQADPDLVVLGAEVMPYRMRSAPGRDAAGTWDGAVAGLVGRLRRGGAAVVVLADIPLHHLDPEICLTDPDATLAGCGTVAGGPRSANERTARVARAAGAAYVDITPLLCLDGRCPAVAGGMSTYGDISHVSVSWSRTVAGPFARLLRQALAGLR